MNKPLLHNYLIIAVRQAFRDKLSTFISIAGLGLSIVAALIITDYVDFERSYDAFHINRDRIYRVTTSWDVSLTSDEHRATTVPWSGPGVKALFPEVESYTRVMPLYKMSGDNAIMHEGNALNARDIILADPDFLTMFSFKLIDGDVNTALTEPRSVLISESVAKKYFSEDPVGRSLTIDTGGNLNGDDFKITGVIGDAPKNSHLRYDFVISYSSMWEGLTNGDTYWHWDNTYCYLLLRPGGDPEGLSKKISEARVRLFGPEMGSSNERIDFHLQPLTDIHLYSSLKGEISVNGNGKYLYFLLILAGCILVCACVNHINLSVAKAIRRQTEIGIRKVTGSTRTQLITQMAVEILVLVAIAIGLAFTVLEIWETSISIRSAGLIFTVIFLMIIVSMIYPASVVSSVRPAEVLKASRIPGRHGWSLRRYLIVVQFFFCIVFTVGTWILFSQLQYIREHDPGFDSDHVIVVKGYGFQPYQSYEAFKRSLVNQESIVAVGSSSAAPGDEVMDLGLRPRISVAGTNTAHEVKLVVADDGFFNAVDIRFLAGRNFNESLSTDREAVIINEATAKLLGFKEPADALMAGIDGLIDKPAVVIGVVKNYNQRSFKTPYEPVVFQPVWRQDFGWEKKNYFVKLKAGNDASIKLVESSWKAAVPALPFNYFYLDDHFEKQYESDQAFISMFALFSGFAVFITLAGLSAVVVTVTAHRTREIGIRKVFGATLQNILSMLSIDFVRLIAIAAVLAIPVVFLVAREWLNTFAFRIGFGVELFIFPFFLLTVTVLSIVVLRSRKAAMVNPVESLRHE